MRREGVGRQCRRGIGDLRAHRTRTEIGVEGHGVIDLRPLRVQGDIRGEGEGSAIGIGGARAVRQGVPAAERIVRAREGVGRQGRRDVGNLRAHRARTEVGVEGHGVIDLRPLGIERCIRHKRVGRTVGIGGACAVRQSVPAAEGVVGAGEGVGCQCRRGVGDLGAHRARTAVGVEGHGVIDLRPLGIEGGIRDESVGRAVGIGGARAVRQGVPAAERVVGARKGVGR